MEETLKKSSSDATETVDKTVTVCLQSHLTVLKGFWTWDMQSHAVYCSDVMHFPDDFEGTKGIIHPDDITKIRSAIELLPDGPGLNLDFRLITTYGEVKKISGQMLTVGSPDSLKSTSIHPVWEEAVQLLVAEKENEFLRLYKELCEAAEKTYSLGCWFINKDTGETWYSDNVFRMYGLAVQSLNVHANTFNPFIYPEDRTTVLEAFENAYTQQVPLHLEYRITTPDGTIRYVRQVTQWSFDRNGNHIFSGIIKNITEEKEEKEYVQDAEAKIKLQQHVLNYSQQQLSTGYWYVNLVTRKSSYSDNFFRIYGIKVGSAVNQNTFLNQVNPDDKEQLQALYEKIYKEHTFPETGFRIVRPDGKQRYLRQSGKLFIHGSSDLVMVLLVQDVTVQLGLEKKIGELNETIGLQNATIETTEELVGLYSVFWLDDGRMLWSDGFFKMLGYRPGGIEPIQRLIHRTIHPEDLKKYKDAELLVLNNQEHEDIRFRIVSKSGMRLFNLSYRRINHSGKEMVLGLVQDITNQELLQQKLFDALQVTELVTNSVNHVIFLTDKDNTIISWNEAAAKKTGIEKQHALNNNIFDVFPGLKEEVFLQQLQAAMNGEEIKVAKSRYHYLKIPHSYYLTPFKNEKAEIIGILHVAEDISRELELQQKLNERLNFIEGLVEASVDRIVVLDKHMNYLYWNRKAEEYYSINKEKIIGKNILEVFPSFRNDPGYSEFRKVLRGDTVYIPVAADNENNEYFETYLAPIKDNTGEVTAVLWMVHDLSTQWDLQQKREIDIKKIKEQAHYLQRITETVPDMLSIMELKTRQFQFLNPETFAIHGFNAKEMANRPREENAEIIHVDDRKILEEYFESFVNASEDYIGYAEYRAKTTEGEWKCFMVRGKVFQRDEEGKVTHILNAIENITDRKKQKLH